MTVSDALARSPRLAELTDACGATLRRRRVAVIGGLVALFGFRLWYIHVRQLLPDEAVYWQWSRHLQWGYLDHPPMLSAMIRLSTILFGTSEFTVRLPMALLAWGSFAVIVALAHALYRQTRITLIVAVIWLTSPLWNTSGTVATPDTPAFFFSACSLACILMALRDQQKRAGLWWLAAGVTCGLALQSKYTSVLMPASVFIALISSKEGRRNLMRAWPWVGAVLAAALFSPVILWNAHHDWVSFRFQLHHGTDAVETAPLRGLGEFVGGQLLLWTPVLFVLGLIVLWTWWGRVTGFWRTNSDNDVNATRVSLSDRILLFAGTLPLVFFGYSATRSHTEMNWPGFAYVPISLLTAKYVAENWPRRIGWVKIGCIVAAVFTIVLHLPELVLKTGVQIPAMTDQFDSRPLAELIERNAGGLPVICNRHQDAGMASFYMTGRPDIWAVSCGSRPTAFDYMTGAPDIHSMPAVAFIGWHVNEFCDEYGFEMAPGKQLELPSARKKKRMMLITILHRGNQPMTRAGEGRDR